MTQGNTSNWMAILAVAAIGVAFLAASALAQIGESVGKPPQKPAAKPAAKADPAEDPILKPVRRPVPEMTPVAPPPVREEVEAKPPRWRMLLVSITVFTLAVFVGLEVIAKVPPTLHTPLCSGSNAISGITVVGSIVVAGSALVPHGGDFSYLRLLATLAGIAAVALAMTNVVGGFLVTHRMLGMFKGRAEK